MHTERIGEGGSALPRWWQAFALPWLLVMVATIGVVIRAGTPTPVLVSSLVLMSLVTGLYLWLTLRAPLTPEDLSEAGPTTAQCRQRLTALAGMGGAIVALMVLLPTTGMWWYVMYLVIAAGLALPTRLAAWTIVVALSATVGLAWLISRRIEVMLLIELAIGGAAMAVRQLTRTVAELRDAREELARRAVLEERLRFARDLHDLVGHSLSLIALKGELARRLLPRQPEAAAREVRDIEQGARDALRHVRAAVHGYRQPSLADELVAARELLTAAGIALDVDVPPEIADAPLPGALDALLAWSVREGITNVVRHSRARRCAITVARVDGVVRVAVADDGRGPGPVGATPARAAGHTDDRVPTEAGDAFALHERPGAGSGLVGLAERVQAAGGRLVAGGRAEGGYRVMVEAPVAGAHAAADRATTGPGGNAG